MLLRLAFALFVFAITFAVMYELLKETPFKKLGYLVKPFLAISMAILTLALITLLF